VNLSGLGSRVSGVKPDLTAYAIYDHPKDHPRFWVVREWQLVTSESHPLAGPVCLANSLEEARAMMPAELVRLGRNPQDDPCLVETWL
jgi:hypothetical protein